MRISDVSRQAKMLAAVLAIGAAGLALAAPASGIVHGIDLTAMNDKVAPGDDFFEYANGAWVARTEIPADQGRWGAFPILRETALKRTAQLIADAAKTKSVPGSPAQKVGDYYASFMDERTIDRKGLSPLKSDLAHIAAIADKRSLAESLGASLRADVDALNATNFYTENLFGLWTAPGFSDPEHTMAYLLQGGLGMPDREYYLADNARMEDARKAYAAHVAKVLTLAGFANADDRAKAIVALETRIAKSHVSRADSEDVLKANNLWSRSDFASKAPGLDWDAFFAAASLDKQKFFDVWQPGAFAGISRAVADEPLAVWKDYLAFHLINRSSSYLAKPFADERFAFYGRTLAGTPKNRDRWKRAVDATNEALGDAVGQLYAARYFTPEAKAAAKEMVDNIKMAFSARIDALSWMSPATKAKAKEKVASLYVGIGYPEKWKDYSSLDVVRGDAFGNWRRSELFEYRRQLSHIGKAVDRSEWAMTPQTVNAVNLPLQNALNFPAAILEKPFFDAKAPMVVNYGAMGSVIGHEISHSFDDQGSQFDASGRLFNWWTKDDLDHFHAEAERLAKQYDAYAPFPDVHLNGHQILGENIADVAGLSASFDAWRWSMRGKMPIKVQGFTSEQAFFIAHAQTRQEKPRDASLRQQILTDGHAPARYRAYEVRNLDPWYDAFDVKPGQKLYLAPEDRVRVW